MSGFGDGFNSNFLTFKKNSLCIRTSVSNDSILISSHLKMKFSLPQDFSIEWSKCLDQTPSIKRSNELEIYALNSDESNKLTPCTGTTRIKQIIEKMEKDYLLRSAIVTVRWPIVFASTYAYCQRKAVLSTMMMMR